MNGLRTPHRRFAAVLITAIALAAVLVAASQVGVDNAAATESEAAAAAATPEPSIFAGIEQQGSALGSPTAPVTLVEYADLQCPYCAQWARNVLPILVENYVKTGKLRIVFNGMAFIGPDSEKALRTAIAAGEENHLWDVVHGLYLSQGAENADWVTDELVQKIVAGVPGLDGERLLETRWDTTVARAIKRAADAAHAAGVHGTPSFQVGATGGSLDLVRLDSLTPEGIVPSIEAVLAR